MRGWGCGAFIWKGEKRIIWVGEGGRRVVGWRLVALCFPDVSSFKEGFPGFDLRSLREMSVRSQTGGQTA